MHIGTIAKATGATAKAIRLYESMGLLPDVRRRGAYRVYSAEHVQLVKWIRQAQELGFRLSELGALQGAIDAPAWEQIAPCSTRSAKALWRNSGAFQSSSKGSMR